MRVSVIEPYFGDSHRHWANGLARHLNPHTFVFSLPPRHWKWRLQGSCFELAKRVAQSNTNFDAFIVSSFLDLVTFRALLARENKNPRFLYYFHENQLSYPLSEFQKGNEVDFSLGMIQLKSALVADVVAFNSEFHKKDFLEAASVLLRKMPDFQSNEIVEELAAKSQVLPLGVDLSDFEAAKRRNLSSQELPVVLWNHRWEYDKNPEFFFDCLMRIKSEGHPFLLRVLGEAFRESPACFEKAEKAFRDEIIEWGYQSDRNQYLSSVASSDVMLVGSNQENFGLSVLEGALLGLELILPKRLVYPEIHGSCAQFYSTQEEACALLRRSLSQKRPNERERRLERYSHLDWQELAPKYLESLTAT